MAPARRLRLWFVAILALDLVDFLFTYQAHRTYVAGPGQPTIMPVGQLLGWAMFVILSITLLLMAVSMFRARRLPSYYTVRVPRE